MKTLLKIAVLAVVGLIAIALVGMVLGTIGFLLKLLIPLAVLAVIGFVVLKFLGGSNGGTKQPSLPPEPPQSPGPGPGPATASKPAKMTDADAARQFEELRAKKPS